MTNDAEQPDNASMDGKPDEPVVHTATLSEPKTQPGEKAKTPKKPKKTKKERPEPTTPMGKLWHNWVKPIGSVILIVVVFRSMLLDWNDVPTGSMEPEIHVGDRIAVNRLAYGLQFPLTGPQIGIPFTPVQFNNPLDGIPQIEWGDGPQRGDIVTFWNPITNVRMVKRIVAHPGDTVSMNGGKLTINGQTASYTNLDPVAEGLPLKTKWQVINPLGKKGYDDAAVDYQRETLLGESRVAQHIKTRWLDNAQLIELANGERIVANDGQIQRRNPVTGAQITLPLKAYLQQTGEKHRVFADIDDGTIRINNQDASYNQLAQAMLESYTTGQVAEILATRKLAMKEHRFLSNGQPVSIEVFDIAVEELAENAGNRDALVPLRQTINLLKATLTAAFGPVTLGDDEHYMVGDNRNNSHDSRYFGPVKRSEITGEAFGVAFSFKDNKMLALPPNPAWSRFFKDLD